MDALLSSSLLLVQVLDELVDRCSSGISWLPFWFCVREVLVFDGVLQGCDTVVDDCRKRVGDGKE